MAYAQAGAEQQRQLDPNAQMTQVPTVDSGFAQYLADQRAALSRAETAQTSFNQNYSPTGTMGKAISGLADVSNLPTGTNPMQALQPYNSSLAQQTSMQTGLNQQVSNANKNILDVLVEMATNKQKEATSAQDVAMKAAQLKKLQLETEAAKKDFELTYGVTVDENGDPVTTETSQADKPYLESLKNQTMSVKDLTTIIGQKRAQRLYNQAVQEGANPKVEGDSSQLKQTKEGIDGMKVQVENIKKMIDEINPQDVLLGFVPGSKLDNLKAAKDLLALQLAKASQGGRLDQKTEDLYRKEIFNIVPNILTVFNKKDLKGKLDSLYQNTAAKVGVDVNQDATKSNSVVMVGQDGKKYTVPSDKVSKFEQNGYRRAQ